MTTLNRLNEGMEERQEVNPPKTISPNDYQKQLQLEAMTDYFKEGNQKTFFQLVIENYMLRKNNRLLQDNINMIMTKEKNNA